MRRLTAGILVVALLIVAGGCGSMQFRVSEPQAAQWTFKNNNILWESWDKESTPLPAVITLNAQKTYLARIDNIPLHDGVIVYARVKTFGKSDFAKAGQVPIVITEQDVQDVQRGNVVRVVVVDPKKEHQTSRFVQLRLSPTEDALKRGKEIGKPLVLVILGNREPKYLDLGAWKRTAASY